MLLRFYSYPDCDSYHPLQRCKLHTYLLHEIMQLAVVFSAYMRLCKRKVVLFFAQIAHLAQTCKKLHKPLKPEKLEKLVRIRYKLHVRLSDSLLSEA